MEYKGRVKGECRHPARLSVRLGPAQRKSNLSGPSAIRKRGESFRSLYNTGLREAKILEIERSWIELRDDGWWLLLPPARSALKETPAELPLNRMAVAALKSDVAYIDEPIFHRRTSDALRGHGHVSVNEARCTISTSMICVTRSPHDYRIWAYRSKCGLLC